MNYDDPIKAIKIHLRGVGFNVGTNISNVSPMLRKFVFCRSRVAYIREYCYTEIQVHVPEY